MFAQFVLSAACVTCHCRPHLAAGRGDRQWMCPRNSINYCEVVPNHRHYMNARHYMDAKNQPLSRHSINTKRILSSRRHCMNHLDMNAKNHHLSSRRRTKKSCYIVKSTRLGVYRGGYRNSLLDTAREFVTVLYKCVHQCIHVV